MNIYPFRAIYIAILLDHAAYLLWISTSHSGQGHLTGHWHGRAGAGTGRGPLIRPSGAARLRRDVARCVREEYVRDVARCVRDGVRCGALADDPKSNTPAQLRPSRIYLATESLIAPLPLKPYSREECACDTLRGVDVHRDHTLYFRLRGETRATLLGQPDRFV